MRNVTEINLYPIYIKVQEHDMAENLSKNLTSFFSNYPIRKYAKGQILLYFNENPLDIYYLESGRVRQYNISHNGTEIVLNIYRKKSVFPVYLALDSQLNENIYAAMSPIEVRKAPISEFREFFTNSPEVVLKHLKDTYIRSNKALRRMTYMVSSSAYYRILFELINECGFLKPKKDGSYQIQLHGYEIAECAGLTRETASREFQKLKEQKLVKVSRKYITVKNLDKLKLELGSHM